MKKMNERKKYVCYRQWTQNSAKNDNRNDELNEKNKKRQQTANDAANPALRTIPNNI